MKVSSILTRFAGVSLCVVAFAGTASAGNGNGNGGGGSGPGEKGNSAAAHEQKADRTQAAASSESKAAAKAAAEAEKAAKAQAKTAARAAHQAEVAAKVQAKAAAKAAAKASVVTTGIASQQTTVTATTPNQGESSKVLTVNGTVCSTPVAGAKVEGGLGTTINVSSTAAIAKVTLKSGEGATVVSSSFAADFKSGTITLSKDVSNYVVWTCGAAAATVPTTTDTGAKTETNVKTQQTAAGQVAGAQTAHGQAGAQTKGEVKGQAKRLAKGKAAAPNQVPSSSGVLGATASAPEAIQETATSGTLPFTGIPLWFTVLLGSGLLLTGVALRRAAQH